MAIAAFPLDAIDGFPKYQGRPLRTTLAALMGTAPAGRPLGCVSGVRPGTPDTTVSVDGSGWVVSPHAGILDVAASASAGPYLYAVAEDEMGPINAPDATYSRLDLISVQLDDPAEGDGTAVADVRIVYTPGMPSATPVVPATPLRSMALARISVPKVGGGVPAAIWSASDWTGIYGDPHPWTDIPLDTGFVSSANAADGRVGCMRDVAGTVFWRGVVLRMGNEPFPTSIDTVIFSLGKIPTWAMPAHSVSVYSIGSTSAASGQVRLGQNGQVSIRSNSVASTYFGLYGLVYHAKE